MEINMTNSNSTWDTVKHWEGVKQSLLDRADVISELDDDEREAATTLRWASCGLHESVDCLMQLDYDDLVDFAQSYEILRDDYDWHTSECEGKTDVMKAGRDVLAKLRNHYPRLSFNQAQSFENVLGHLHRFFDTKPNKHQMGKFTEHGITWEGEVYDY